MRTKAWRERGQERRPDPARAEMDKVVVEAAERDEIRLEELELYVSFGVENVVDDFGFVGAADPLAHTVSV